jgi:hypothetical protein
MSIRHKEMILRLVGLKDVRCMWNQRGKVAVRLLLTVALTVPRLSNSFGDTL